MTDKITESVARAISDADAEHDGSEDYSTYWATLTVSSREEYRRHATAAIAAYREAVGSEAIGVLCHGCGSSWDDERLKEERKKNRFLKSCCPERKMLPVFAAPPATQPVKAKADTEKAALSLAQMVTVLVEDCTRLQLDFRVGLNTKIQKRLERFVEPKSALESAPTPEVTNEND